MEASEIITIICAILGSGGLWTFIQAIINKKSNTTKRIECIERDCNRTQLLLLMKSYPDHHTEIMRVAQEYFVNLNGNWYMDSLFTQWLDSENLPRPSWYKEE